MKILSAPAQVELTFQKSKFLGLLQPVRSAEEARALLRETKVRFADATHVVHAFRTGPEGSETCGCSDDGEPSGTAGRPVLDVLKGAGGGNSLLLVIRWFGGTKLGTGGLVKAYGETAKSVVATATWEEARVWVAARIMVEWGEHRQLVAELSAVGARVMGEVFSSGVTVEAQIPLGAFADLQEHTGNLTRGRTQWLVLG